MKKKNIVMLGVGAGTAALAACAVVKNLFDKHKDEDLNDVELTKVNVDSEEEDRGVDPLEKKHHCHHDGHDEVKDLKADAMNHGYQPIKY